MNFYFEQLLQTGLSGIDQQGITAAVLQIASVVLVLSLLWSVYEAYSSGGDVRMLGTAAIKYLVVGLVFLNYPLAFRAVNGMFSGVADGIYNLTGAGDVVKQWMNAASNQWNGNQDWFSSIWNLVTGGSAAIVSAIITIIGYLLLPITYALFTLFYAMYGSILYVVGPLVLALIPSRGLGQIGRSFFVNLMVFQSWGVLYAILQALMSALQINSANAFINNTSFLNSFVGASSMILMSLASVLLSVMIALIPFIASRIVRGDVGATMMTVVGTAITAGTLAAGLAIDGAGGLAAGRTATPEGPPTPPPTPGAPSIGGQSSTIIAGGSSDTSAQILAGSGGSGLADSRSPGPLSSQAASNPAIADNQAAASTAPAAGPSTSSGSGGSGSASGYRGRSITGFAAWQAGHLMGRTLRWAGMGKEA